MLWPADLIQDIMYVGAWWSLQHHTLKVADAILKCRAFLNYSHSTKTAFWILQNMGDNRKLLMKMFLFFFLMTANMLTTCRQVGWPWQINESGSVCQPLGFAPAVFLLVKIIFNYLSRTLTAWDRLYFMFYMLTMKWVNKISTAHQVWLSYFRGSVKFRSDIQQSPSQ